MLPLRPLAIQTDLHTPSLLPTAARHDLWRQVPASVKRPAGSVTVRCSPRRRDSLLSWPVSPPTSTRQTLLGPRPDLAKANPCFSLLSTGPGISLPCQCNHGGACSRSGPSALTITSGKLRCPAALLPGTRAWLHVRSVMCAISSSQAMTVNSQEFQNGKGISCLPSFASLFLPHVVTYIMPCNARHHPSTVMFHHQLSRSSPCIVVSSPPCSITYPALLVAGLCFGLCFKLVASTKQPGEQE